VVEGGSAQGVSALFHSPVQEILHERQAARRRRPEAVALRPKP
jgi:hypothetical protein